MARMFNHITEVVQIIQCEIIIHIKGIIIHIVEALDQIIIEEARQAPIIRAGGK